eukprot:2497115-Rhodomonas_salina.2
MHGATVGYLTVLQRFAVKRDSLPWTETLMLLFCSHHSCLYQSLSRISTETQWGVAPFAHELLHRCQNLSRGGHMTRRGPRLGDQRSRDYDH